MHISFDARVYSRSAIESSIEEYKRWAGFQLLEQGGQFVVEIKPTDPDVKEIIVDEFSNFVLARMQG